MVNKGYPVLRQTQISPRHSKTELMAWTFLRNQDSRWEEINSTHFFVGKWSPCVPSERPKFWDFQASSEERRIYPWEKTPSAIQTADLLLLIDTVYIYIYYIVGYQPMVTLLIFKQLVIFQLPSRIDEISNRKCRLWELELMKICPPRRLQTELSRSPLKNAWVT